MATQEVDLSKSRSGAPRRVAAGLLAGALAVLGLALAPPAGAVDDVTTDRVAGLTRYSTAGDIAAQADFDDAADAILATGENFPDALAASGLAGANGPAPIILTQTNTLNDETKAALAGVEDLDDILAVGGTAAIADDVIAEVEDLGYSVTRVAGVDRYETAAAIADAANNVGEIDNNRTALIASGEVFPDALAGGPLAYQGDMPILLMTTDGVPASTRAALEDNDIEQVVILGGTARITDAGETALEGIVGNPAIRVAGVDRFETAADVARFAEAEFGWAPEEVLLATGVNFPDALACGPLGGERSAPIILTGSWPAPSAEYLDEVSDTVERITACGGTAPISDADLAAAEASAETTDNDAATGGNTQTSELEGPELQSASVTGLDLDDLEVVVSYVFDQDLDEDSADAGLFKLYNADTRNPITGDAAGIEEDVSGDTVDITYSLVDYAVTDAKLAAVEEGAVDDEDGNTNPPQSVTIVGGSGSGTQFADLVSAEVTDEDEAGLTDEVTFTFSEATTVTTSGRSFEVVLEDGTDVTCTGAATDPDADEASEEITAICGFADGNDPVRGVSQQTLLNGSSLVQTAEMARSGNSDGPDLASVTTERTDDDLGDDEVVFTFDEAIDSPAIGDAGVIDNFNLYYSHCNPTSFGGTEVANPCTVAAESISFDPDEDEQVIAQFPDDSINEFLVGAFVREDSVEEAGAGTLTNKDDEVSISQTGWKAGDVAAPQLTSVDAVIDNTASGNFQDFEVTFTFDRNIDDDVALDDADFSVWFDVDGETDSLTLEDCEYEGDTQVICHDTDEDSEIADAVVGAVDAGAVQTNEEFTIEDDEQSVQMPNPEGSAAFEAPGEPDPDTL